MSRTLQTSRSPAVPAHVDRTLIECSPFPMVELEGNDHVVREANSLFCRLIDKPKAAIVGKRYADVVHDRSSLDVLQRVYRSRSCELHGEVEQIEGPATDWSYIVWPVLDTSDQAVGVVMQVTGPTLLQRARAMNEALMVSVVQQHERTDVAEAINARLEAEIEERKRAEEALSQSEARFRALVAMSSDWYWEQDENFRFTEVNEPNQRAAHFMPVNYLAKTRWELQSSGLSEEQWAKHRELLLQHKPFRGLEYQRVGASGSMIWVSVSGEPVFDNAGQFRGYRGTGRDISERKRHEEQIQLIMREVCHRENNMLSLVMAIAKQTAAADPKHFLERFSARLQSIAANQTLLAENRWHGVEVGALVQSQLGHFEGLFEKRVSTSGPKLRLRAGAARVVGMALHELATNAVKYGALSNDVGRVQIGWRVHQDENGSRFEVRWIESGGPPVTPPTKQGFGSTVIGRMARAGLSADISLEFPSTGLRWSLECPASTALEVEQGRHL